MERRGVVVGQKVAAEKLEAAKSLRRYMTPEEQTLWQAIRANRLHGLHFRRQQVIDGFIVDFYCHAASLVVEVDSPSHQRQKEYDAARDQLLAARDLRILRVPNRDIRANLAAVLARIADLASVEPNPLAPFPAREGGTQIAPLPAGEGKGER